MGSSVDNQNWFDIDKTGLSKLFAGKSKVFILHELVANAWDTGSRVVNVSLTKEHNARKADIVVEDLHPEGFADLRHAYTLFAESTKKGDANTRGRFNFGEKAVLSMCTSATIETTKGRITFDERGRSTTTTRRREAGSVFTGSVPMTNSEMLEAIADFYHVISPVGVVTTFNGVALPTRTPKAVVNVTLPTVAPDVEGVMRRRERKTDVLVYDIEPGETGTIYELGIPVVATGDSYHVNVMQKVPVSIERDNVSPEYLRRVRAAVADVLVSTKALTSDTAQEAWVTDALSHPSIDPETVRAIVTKRFGEQAAVFDPSDREANNRLTSQGYTVVHGRSLPKAAWENVRAANALQPSGVLSPTPKPYSDDPDAPPVTVVPEEEWTEGMRAVADFAKDLAREVLPADVKVRMVKAKGFAACYCRAGNFAGHLDFNVASLRPKWFETRAVTEVVDLVVHELGHHEESNHLSERYHNAITRLAGEVANLALTKPEMFAKLKRARFT